MLKIPAFKQFGKYKVKIWTITLASHLFCFTLLRMLEASYSFCLLQNVVLMQMQTLSHSMLMHGMTWCLHLHECYYYANIVPTELSFWHRIMAQGLLWYAVLGNFVRLKHFSSFIVVCLILCRSILGELWGWYLYQDTVCPLGTADGRGRSHGWAEEGAVRNTVRKCEILHPTTPPVAF